MDKQKIFEILASFEDEFESMDKENEIQELKYYDIFKIDGIKYDGIPGVFLSQEKDADGNISYHLYYQSPANEILSMDHEGNIVINDNWREAIRDIHLESAIQINDAEGRLQGVSKKVEPEKLQKELKKEDEEKEEEEPEEQIEEDLGEEDLDIGYYRKIKDPNFDEQMGMNLKGYQEIGLAFSKTQNQFILVGQKNGKFERIEQFEPARPTFKTVMSIDEKGEKVEKQVPYALMKTNNSEKELSITIGQYGYIEVGTVDRLPCDERVKRQVREQGEDEEGRTVKELNRTVEEKGVEVGLHEWAHKNEEQHEEMEQGEEREGNISEEISTAEKEDEYIPDTDVKWIDFANQCGYRGQGAITHAKEVFEEGKRKNPDKTNKELAEDIPEEKVEETPYGQRNQI